MPELTQRKLIAGVAVAASIGVGYAVYRASDRRAASSRSFIADGPGARIRILFGSITGTSERRALKLATEIQALAGRSVGSIAVQVQVENLATFSFDALLEKPKAGAAKDVVLVLQSTTTDGAPPEHCAHFLQLLEDHVHDFRVGKTALIHQHFAVLGFGNSEYEAAGHFCTAAIRTDKAFEQLYAKRLVPMLRVDDAKDQEKQVRPWTVALLNALQTVGSGGTLTEAPAFSHPSTVMAAGEDVDSDDESDASSTTAPDEGEFSSVTETKGNVDLEDLEKTDPEMLTKKHRAQLQKEGYKLIGSHSAVKLCRWTKHQLRGRGGCYKHSFYGITSYGCMEATPSLACANKCTFCWRHHKNPVAKEWKWKADDPIMIVKEAIENQIKMIKECKGVPGVQPERFAEAMKVKHCALSLVGEPIMYPRINELCNELHRRRISTFLVTNAQFPDAIRNLVPITQLYVSVDAPTKEELKAIDRPLHQDFWERYIDSLTALRDKAQRTVYRMTLVKDHNTSDAGGYAKLVALGNPDFIEIKAVTFCGESKASTLKISNTPFHDEVKAFAEEMLRHHGLSDDYEMACEHQHSNIVLIANKRYKIDGRWHTWIDFDKFAELVEKGTNFGVKDYMEPTPEWAVYGAKEAGFDPAEKRVYHNRTVRRAQAGQLSEVQLKNYPSDPANVA
jgi:tRNA wybutosine-synthesizing protein 1